MVPVAGAALLVEVWLLDDWLTGGGGCVLPVASATTLAFSLSLCSFIASEYNNAIQLVI